MGKVILIISKLIGVIGLIFLGCTIKAFLNCFDSPCMGGLLGGLLFWGIPTVFFLALSFVGIKWYKEKQKDKDVG